MEDIFNSGRAPRDRFLLQLYRIHRMQTILDISAEFGRKVALVGRSMTSATEIAHSLGRLTIPTAC